MSQLREYRTNQPFLQCNVTAFLVKTKIFGLTAKVLTAAWRAFLAMLHSRACSLFSFLSETHFRILPFKSIETKIIYND